MGVVVVVVVEVVIVAVAVVGLILMEGLYLHNLNHAAETFSLYNSMI